MNKYLQLYTHVLDLFSLWIAMCSCHSVSHRRNLCIFAGRCVPSNFMLLLSFAPDLAVDEYIPLWEYFHVCKFDLEVHVLRKVCFEDWDYCAGVTEWNRADRFSYSLSSVTEDVWFYSCLLLALFLFISGNAVAIWSPGFRHVVRISTKNSTAVWKQTCIQASPAVTLSCCMVYPKPTLNHCGLATWVTLQSLSLFRLYRESFNLLRSVAHPGVP